MRKEKEGESGWKENGKIRSLLRWKKKKKKTCMEAPPQPLRIPVISSSDPQLHLTDKRGRRRQHHERRIIVIIAPTASAPPTDTNYRHAVGVTLLPGNRLTSACERNNSISRKCCLDCCSAFQCVAVCQSGHYVWGRKTRERGEGRLNEWGIEGTVWKLTNAVGFLFMRTKEVFVREGNKNIKKKSLKNANTTLTGVHAAKGSAVDRNIRIRSWTRNIIYSRRMRRWYKFILSSG